MLFSTSDTIVIVTSVFKTAVFNINCIGQTPTKIRERGNFELSMCVGHSSKTLGRKMFALFHAQFLNFQARTNRLYFGGDPHHDCDPVGN